MIAVTLSSNPKTENIDSAEQLERLTRETEKVLDELGPSMRTMLNFTLDDGNLVAANWVDSRWFRKLHTGHIPVVTWLTIAPLQVSTSFRGSFPRLHRMLGYMFFSISACICAGLIALISTGRVYGYPHWAALLLNVLKSAYFAMSPAKALRFAMERKLTKHRHWIARHLAMGYTVSLQRVMLFVLGPMLHANGFIWATPTIKEKQIWYNITSYASTILPLLLIEVSMRTQPSHSISLEKEKKAAVKMSKQV